MSNMIIELLTIAVVAIAVASKQTQVSPESVVVRVPVDDKIRRS